MLFLCYNDIGDNMKKTILLVILFITISLTTACDNYKSNLGINFNINGNETDSFSYSDNPEVAMKIEGYGEIVIELYPNIAPNTVNNFIYLVKTGFYDNNSFHRLVKGFVLQGGDPKGDGTGGPGYHIKGEFTNNHFTNTLKHTKGIVSMGKSTSPDSAGSQFFIVLAPSSNLDGNYAAFGKVTQGMEIIDRIADNEEIKNKQTGKLAKNVKILKAIVNTKGVTYPEPEKINP